MNTTLDLLRAIFALTFVLGLLWLLGYVLRRYGARWGLAPPMTAKAQRRLKILEILPIDGRTRLVLIQRDAVQHLLMIGADGSQTVVEQAIAPHTISAPSAIQGDETI